MNDDNMNENSDPSELRAATARMRIERDALRTVTLQRGEAAETAIAEELLRAARLLIDCQEATQREAIPTLRALLKAAAEIEVQVRLGPFPSVRLVALDSTGEETHLLRGLDLR